MNKKHLTDEEIQKLHDRQSFLLPKSLMALVNIMDNEDRGLLLTAILSYGINLEEIDISRNKLVLGAFNLFKQDFNKEGKRYVDRCKKNSANVKKRWDSN